MKGRPEDESSRVFSEGSGTGRGRFGFAVADVGRGGSEMISGVMPGIRIATTFCTERGFCLHISISGDNLCEVHPPRLEPSLGEVRLRKDVVPAPGCPMSNSQPLLAAKHIHDAR